MKACLGLDTSNYTTSTALLLPDGALLEERRLLPVADGARGLRQADALFLHNRQLPELMEALFARAPGTAVGAVGVSAAPRDAEGSYMPCFLAGVMLARGLAAAMSVPLHSFSHQAGHVAAALYSAGRLDWLAAPFIALHVSGGTTECLLAEGRGPGELELTPLSASADLNAGQVVDRVGVSMGFPFPAGRHLDQLAMSAGPVKPPKIAFREGKPCLSGLENQCMAQLKRGVAREEVARSCLEAIGGAVWRMAQEARERTGTGRVLLGGGVMASRTIRRMLEGREGVVFAQPAFSSDNAAGIAVLTAAREGSLK